MKKKQLVNRLFWNFFAYKRQEMDFTHQVLFEDMMIRRWNNRYKKSDIEDVLHQIELNFKGDLFSVIEEDFNSCFNFFKSYHFCNGKK